MERRVQITVIEIIGADIGVLPGPQHCQEVVWIAAAEICLPAADEEVLKRGKAELAPHFLAVEGLAQAPSGIDPAHRLKAARRRAGEPAVLPCSVGRQRRLHTLEKNEIVWRCLRRAADWGDALDAIREQRSPMKRLLGAHRETVDKMYPLDPEHLLK